MFFEMFTLYPFSIIFAYFKLTDLKFPCKVLNKWMNLCIFILTQDCECRESKKCRNKYNKKFCSYSNFPGFINLCCRPEVAKGSCRVYYKVQVEERLTHNLLLIRIMIALVLTKGWVCLCLSK